MNRWAQILWVGALVGVGVVVLERDCQLLRSGDQVEVPVWQSGNAWDTTTSEVVLPDGGRVRLGDEIAPDPACS